MSNKVHQKYPSSVQHGKPRLAPLKNGWHRVLIGNLVEPVSRPVEMQDDEIYTLVTAKRSRGGIVKRENLKGADIAVKNQFYVREGDFLISKRQIVHGACGFVPKDLDGAIVSNEYLVLGFTDKIIPEFWEFLSHTLIFKKAIEISNTKIKTKEIELLIACEELLNDQRNSFFDLIQNASSSHNNKPISEKANFKEAIKLLSREGDILEIDFIRACETLINKISNFRNDRGDISHGREVPKTLCSDLNLSRLIIEITESLLRYTLASFFVIDLEKKAKEFEEKQVQEEEEKKNDQIKYEANPAFKDFLDEEYPLDGKLLYSQALHALYYEDYEIRLQNFLYEQGLLEDE